MAENEKARDQIRIVSICGSLRPGSYTRMALHDDALAIGMHIKVGET